MASLQGDDTADQGGVESGKRGAGCRSSLLGRGGFAVLGDAKLEWGNLTAKNRRGMYRGHFAYFSLDCLQKEITIDVDFMTGKEGSRTGFVGKS